jgi:hypothetical protein
MRPPREGEDMRPMRLSEDDIEDKEPGLYQACSECVEEHRERIAERLGVDVEMVTNNGLC